MGADAEALQAPGRRLGREAGEVLVVRRDFLSQGKPATGKRARRVCLAAAVGVSSGPGRRAAQRVSRR